MGRTASGGAEGARMLAVAATALITFAPASDATSAPRPAQARQHVDLRLANPREVDKLEVTLPNPAVTRLARKPVTDLVLIASAAAVGSDIEAALAAPNANPPAARLYGVRLLLVVGGRLQHAASALCGGWNDDRSQCLLACDGGRFEIIRRLSAEGPTFRMHLGGEDGAGEGLLVSSCEAGETEMRLSPKAGRTDAEVVLLPDR